MSYPSPSGSSFRPNQQQQYAPVSSSPIRPQRPPRFGFQAPLPYPRPRSSASKPNSSSSSSYLDKGSPYGTFNTNQNRSFNSKSNLSHTNRMMNTTSDTNSSCLSDTDSYVTCLDASFSARSDTSFGGSSKYGDDYNESTSYYNNQAPSGNDYSQSPNYYNDQASSGNDLNQNNNYFSDSASSGSGFNESTSYYSNSPLINAYGNAYAPQTNLPSFSGAGSNKFRKVSRPPGAKFKRNMQQQAVIPNNQGNFVQPSMKRPIKRKASTLFHCRCDTCGLDFTSRIPLEMHLRGAKHQKKLKTAEVMRALEFQGHTKVVPATPKLYRCETCQISLNGPLQLQTHMDGTKHKNKVKELENKMDDILTTVDANKKQQQQQNGEAKQKTKATPSETQAAESKPSPSKMAKLSCDVCSIVVNSENQLVQHLGSKKHLAKVEGKPLPKKKKQKDSKQEGESMELDTQTNGKGLPTDTETGGIVKGVPPLSSTFVQQGSLS